MAFGLHPIASRMMAVFALLGAYSASAVAQESVVEQSASIGTTISKTNHMVVPVRIAEKGPYPFIIDTAAERSVLSRELASELGLKASSRARLTSMTASREIAVVDVADLSFMPDKSHKLPAFLLNGDDIGAAGVLGIDVLRGQRIVLDFAGQSLSVEPGVSRPIALDKNEIVVHGRRRLGQLILAECSINGVPVDVVVDSGLQVSLGNDALRRLLTTKGTVQTVSLVSVTGESFTAEYTKADQLLIGNAQFVGMPIAFADLHFFKKMKLTRTPALLLGMDALQMFARVSVDFRKSEVRFLFPSGANPAGTPNAAAMSKTALGQ
jgi:predicted aspartyl protease